MDPIQEQQPRERLLRLGAAKLSDVELVTIVLGSGSSGIPAADTARRLLAQISGRLQEIHTCHPADLLTIPGFGKAKYCSLMAGMELGRRMILRPTKKRPVINNAKQACQIFREYLPTEGLETILALYLNNGNRILALEEVASHSNPSGCQLDLRKLLKSILNLNASSLILAHNHPSDRGRASDEDIRMSANLFSLLKSMGIELLDHLIILKENFTRIKW